MNIVITMSRRYGAGTGAIAAELSKELKVPVYNKDSIQKKLEQHEYETEAAAIRELAEKPCIIVGRCASEVLKDKSNVLNIYVYADKEDRIQRVMGRESMEYDEAKKLVEETDAARADYYYDFTGKAWGDVNNYHFILDTSKYGVENCAGMIMKYLEKAEYI